MLDDQEEDNLEDDFEIHNEDVGKIVSRSGLGMIVFQRFFIKPSFALLTDHSLIGLLNKRSLKTSNNNQLYSL